MINNEDKLEFDYEDTILTFDAVEQLLAILHDATIRGIDEDNNEIPGYVFAREFASLFGIDEEKLVEIARQNDFNIFTVEIITDDFENNLGNFVICAKGFDPESLVNEYKEILDVDIKLTKTDENEQSEELKEERTNKNQLRQRAKRHKKTDKKGARGWFVNPNAGNVEHNISFFNNAMGNNSAINGVGMGEDLHKPGDEITTGFNRRRKVKGIRSVDVWYRMEDGGVVQDSNISDEDIKKIAKLFNTDVSESIEQTVIEMLPIANESKVDFISRFMSDDKMIKEYPNPKQRYAVALSYWEKK